MLELTEQGFYEIREQGRQAALVTVAASNVELAESDRTAVDPEEIVAAVTGGAGAIRPPGRARRALPDEAQETVTTSLVVPAVRGYSAFDGRIPAGAQAVAGERVDARAGTM